MAGDLAVTPRMKRRIEAIGRELGLDRGTWTMEFRLGNGNLELSHFHHSPVKNAELEDLADELRRRAAQAGYD